MQVHYAEVSLIHLKPDGTPYTRSKGTTTIKEACQFTTEHRVFPDPTNPNTDNYPSIRDYLVLEAAAGFEPVQIGQYFIITKKP